MGIILVCLRFAYHGHRNDTRSIKGRVMIWKVGRLVSNLSYQIKCPLSLKCGLWMFCYESDSYFPNFKRIINYEVKLWVSLQKSWRATFAYSKIKMCDWVLSIWKAFCVKDVFDILVGLHNKCEYDYIVDIVLISSL